MVYFFVKSENQMLRMESPFSKFIFQGVMNQLKKNGWEKETHSADEITEDEIQKGFMIVDRDASGFLSRKEAKRACKLIGEKFGIDEVKQMSLH